MKKHIHNEHKKKKGGKIMANKIKSPKEIASVVRASSTFVINNELTLSKCEDRQSPLKFYEPSLSRFPVTIINFEKGNPKKEILKGNINVAAIPLIDKKTNFIFNKAMEQEMEEMMFHEQPDEKLSIAYTVTFPFGDGLKGKSPAQVLLENPENGKELLNKQYLFLKENLNKNPKFKESNQKLIDAIFEASNLQKNGQLSAESVKNSGTKSREFIIYATGFRPLTKKKNARGNNFVYDITIKWILGANYPVMFELVNFWAPVVKTEKGLLNVMAKNKEDEIKTSFSMTAEEWLDIMHIINSNMRVFENMYGPALYKRAREAEEENRREAGINQN